MTGSLIPGSDPDPSEARDSDRQGGKSTIRPITVHPSGKGVPGATVNNSS